MNDREKLIASAAGALVLLLLTTIITNMIETGQWRESIEGRLGNGEARLQALERMVYDAPTRAPLDRRR